MLSLDPAEYSDSVEILTPGEEGDRTTRLLASPDAPATGAAIDKKTEINSSLSNESIKPSPDANKLEKPLRLSAIFRDTDEPGVYTVRLLRQSQVSEDRLIAYNPQASEGDLGLASTVDLKKRLGNVTGVSIQEFGQLNWVEGREAGAEIRQWLLWALLALLILEQALAYRLGYHPPSTGNAVVMAR